MRFGKYLSRRAPPPPTLRRARLLDAAPPLSSRPNRRGFSTCSPASARGTGTSNTAAPRQWSKFERRPRTTNGVAEPYKARRLRSTRNLTAAGGKGVRTRPVTQATRLGCLPRPRRSSSRTRWEASCACWWRATVHLPGGGNRGGHGAVGGQLPGRRLRCRAGSLNRPHPTRRSRPTTCLNRSFQGIPACSSAPAS